MKAPRLLVLTVAGFTFVASVSFERPRLVSGEAGFPGLGILPRALAGELPSPSKPAGEPSVVLPARLSPATGGATIRSLSPKATPVALGSKVEIVVGPPSPGQGPASAGNTAVSRSEPMGSPVALGSRIKLLLAPPRPPARREGRSNAAITDFLWAAAAAASPSPAGGSNNVSSASSPPSPAGAEPATEHPANSPSAAAASSSPHGPETAPGSSGIDNADGHAGPEGPASADARKVILDASAAKHFEDVVKAAAAAPDLLTCDNPEILWRLAEAFGETQRDSRELDVYRYILTRCTDPAMRLDTMQRAVGRLTRAEYEPLLALGTVNADGDEFRAIREKLARDAVSSAASDPQTSAGDGDLRLMQQVAEANGSASDALLIGNYFRNHGDDDLSEHWYRLSYQSQASAAAAQGLALALVALKRPVDAEMALAPWRKADEETNRNYLAIVAQLLAPNPPTVLAPDALGRMAAAVAERRDVSLAQAFGWYAYAFKQNVVALRWFATALDWKPDEEPSAYGFAMVSRALGRADALRDVVKAWGDRSPRIRAIAQGVTAETSGGTRNAPARPAGRGAQQSGATVGTAPL